MANSHQERLKMGRGGAKRAQDGPKMGPNKAAALDDEIQGGKPSQRTKYPRSEGCESEAEYGPELSF